MRARRLFSIIGLLLCNERKRGARLAGVVAVPVRTQSRGLRDCGGVGMAGVSSVVGKSRRGG
jgi:predicted DNA-binding transcriptional regulator YafY